MKILKYLFIAILCIIVFSIAWLFLRKSHVVPKAEVIEKTSMPESKFWKWKYSNIHYIEKGEGEDILLVHGLGGSVFDFEDLFYLLADDYHVIAVDLPGFSLSDSPDMGVYDNPNYRDMYSSFMIDFINYKQLDSFHLVGNSMGGWMSWETAADHGEKLSSLSLIAPAGYDMEEVAEHATGWLKNPLINIILAKGLPRSVTEINIGMCYANDSLIEEEEIVRRNMVSNKEGNLDWLKELGLASDFPDTSRIATITNPTIIFWGTEDEIIPYDHAAKFHRDIRGSQLITYTNAGHCPQMEITQQFYTDLTAFIAAN